MSIHAKTLAEIPLFSLLDEAHRLVLAERVEVATATQGELIFRYGDPGETMYIVQSGAVELWTKTKTGEKVVFETCRAGDFFGEISLLDHGPRTASATAVEDGEMLLIDRGDLDELFRLEPGSVFALLGATGRRLRKNALMLRNTATRNVNEEVCDERSLVMKAADGIAAFSGSLPFLFMHLGAFFIWIMLNVHVLPFGNFDPFPFGFLTLVVSLEAIILSVFVLLSQNRQIERERVRSDIEYDVNLKAELQIQHMHEKIDDLNSGMLARLERMEKNGKPTERESRRSLRDIAAGDP
jgi:CRP/FNR family transcriptional regulator, cyclic AMP receptor protein